MVLSESRVASSEGRAEHSIPHGGKDNGWHKRSVIKTTDSSLHCRHIRMAHRNSQLSFDHLQTATQDAENGCDEFNAAQYAFGEYTSCGAHHFSVCAEIEMLLAMLRPSCTSPPKFVSEVETEGQCNVALPPPIRFNRFSRKAQPALPEM